MKKAIVYSPYWNTLGGGEKYVAMVCKTLEGYGYEVRVYWDDKDLLKKIKNRFDIDLFQLKIDKEGYLAVKYGNWLHKRKFMWQADLVFFVSDGSIPTLFGKKNILHFQVPFHDVKHKNLMRSLKLKTIDMVVCNSRFTKAVIDREYEIESRVLYPPAEMILPAKKNNTILSIGRFDNLLHAKRQDVLIKAFDEMKLKDWKLILAGGLQHGNVTLNKLEKLSTNPRIEFVVNPNWNELKQLIAKARIYWHAAGYGADLTKSPEKAEHFGISVVEAMSAGTIPIVFNGGGLTEIVTHDVTGYLWNTPDQLIRNTMQLVNDSDLEASMRTHSVSHSGSFSMEVFESEFEKLIS
jgi:glycosyltransferase involved in cell wall biosynthesis